MDNIEYVEEEVKELIAVYYGEYTNDEIYEQLKEANISTEEIEIVHTNDNNNPRVDVYQYVKKQVPYKVERTLIETFPIDSLRNQSIQEKRANALMHVGSLEKSDNSRYEVVEEKDEKGNIISYQVYKVQKTPYQTEKSIVPVTSQKQEEDETNLKAQLDIIKQERDKLASLTSTEEKKTLLQAVNGQLDKLEKNVATESAHRKRKNSPKLTEVLGAEVTKLDSRISEIEESLKKLVAEHNQIEQELMASLPEPTDDSTILTEEEQTSKEQEEMERKLKANKESAILQRRINAEEKYLAQLKRRREVKQKDYKAAEKLDLTVDEYLLIQDTIGRKKLEEALMSTKGLSDIYNKPYKERTKEEKEKIRKATEEIIREIHAKREEDQVSVLDAIQSLYHLDVKFSKGANPRVLSVTQHDRDAITEKIANSPSKIVQNKDSSKVKYEPAEAPKDMPRQDDFKEKFVLFRDTRSEDVYIREYGLERFNLVPIGSSVKINGAICYPISKEDADYIIENQNNENSPYIVISRGIESVQVEEVGSKETMNNAVYIKELLKHIKDNDLDIYHYYVDLANNYRNNPKYEPPEFEKNNPFLTEEDYRNLIESKEERIAQYFASTMRKVIDYNIANYEKEETNIKTPEEDSETSDKTYKKVDNKIDIEEWLKDMNEQLDKYQNQTTPLDTETSSIDIYQDIDKDNQKYAPESIMKKYNINPTSDELIINGDKSYQISDDDYSKIENSAEEEGKTIDLVDVHLDEDKLDNKKIFPRGIEKINLYQDTDTNKFYVTKAVLNRFNINPISEETRINDRYCFGITDEDANYIIENQENDYSPYIVEIVPFQLSHENTTDIPKEDSNLDNSKGLDNKDSSIILDDDKEEAKDNEKDEDDEKDAPEDDKEETIEKIPIFRDIANNNDLYATETILQKFGLSPETEKVQAMEFDIYKLTDEQINEINKQVKESTNPKKEIVYTDISLEKKKSKEEHKGEKHYQVILQELTEGLDNLSLKGEQHFHASNISVGQAAEELRTGNWLYNVVGFVPKVVSLPIAFFRKISSSILLTASQKEDYQELIKRLDELSDEDLEILFRDYRGVNAKADANLGINTCVAARLRRYVMDKVEKLNETIKENYTKLLAYLGKIKEIEEKIASGNISTEEKNTLLSQRTSLIELGAECAIAIDKDRKEGIMLLDGSGLHSFEDDMKAVNSRMSYVGYRFAKQQNGFDHETQELLAKFGQGFNDAIAAGNPEAIIENFMNYEACYIDNTEIRNSIFGRRSVGSKYYTPLLEELNYQDDPFVSNLLTTIALTTAAISAANAYHVHKVEGDRLLKTQQQEAAQVNAANDAAIDKAHQVGRHIEGQRQTMMEGMQTQSMHGVEQVSATLERKGLDVTANDLGWDLSNPDYTIIDQAHHELYNNLYQNVSTGINDVASKCAAGTITQSQALEEIARIANEAQKTLNDILADYLPALEQYASEHPEFDLTAFEETMRYAVAHPGSVIDMNNGIIDIMEEAGTLSTLSAEHITALKSLPSDFLTTIISATSATALAWRVSRDMNKGHSRKATYGNEVTDMMEEFFREEEVPEEEVQHTR